MGISTEESNSRFLKWNFMETFEIYWENNGKMLMEIKS